MCSGFLWSFHALLTLHICSECIYIPIESQIYTHSAFRQTQRLLPFRRAPETHCFRALTISAAVKAYGRCSCTGWHVLHILSSKVGLQPTYNGDLQLATCKCKYLAATALHCRDNWVRSHRTLYEQLQPNPPASWRINLIACADGHVL